MKLNRYDLIELRNVGVITTPECMVILTFHFGNFEKMLREHSRKILRKLYAQGINKLLKKNENNKCEGMLLPHVRQVVPLSWNHHA